MSSLLRSSKFIRYFAGAARNIIVTSSRCNGETGQLQNVHLLTVNSTSLFATRAAATPKQYSSNLERSLQQLDQDVRRTGRISRRELDDVLEELRQSKSATSSQSLLVIRCCGNLVPEEMPQVRTKLVQEIWATLEKLQVPMDISHYNALLRVYLENEHNFSPAEFLQDLEKKGVEPNRVTYQRLVTRYCQQGDIEGATRILEFMREKGLPVNENVFNALVMGHSQAGDMDSATGILNVMKQAGLEPSSDTYTTLLVGHAKRGEIDKVQSILAECDKKEIYLLDKDHLEIAFALASNGHTEYIDEILSRIRKSSGFNQDAVSTILRLVNHGQEQVALKLLRMMPRPQKDDGDVTANQGTFFIRQMVKAKRPVESILNVCKTLESEGMNSRALSIAAETALHQGYADLACSLLKALKEHGYPIRQHYFWPLFCAAGRNRDDDTVAKIITQMNESFGIILSGETVRDYIIPNLTFTDRDYTIGFLKRAGVSSGATACSLVHELLVENRIAEAADTASKYRAFYSPLLLRRPLNLALIRTGVVDHYLNILHIIYDGMDRSFQGEEPDNGAIERRDLVGNFLLDLLQADRANKINLKPILEGLLAKGLGITNDAAEQIQSKLSGERLTNAISELLTKLTSTDLEATKPTRTRIPDSAFVLDEAALIDKIQKLDAAGQSSVSTKRTLVSQLLKNQEFEKAEQIIKELGAEAGPGVYAMAIEAYSSAKKTNEALNMFGQFKALYPESKLDPLKLLRLVEALVKENRIPEGVDILEQNTAERKFDEVPFVLKSAAFQILNQLAEIGDVENLEKVFDLLAKNQYVDITNVLLGPLVKVHVLKNDIPTALQKFEEISLKYKATPWKGELAKKLIQAEDAASLQKLTDISSKVHGEINSLYDLVFSFVECGRIRQARKILETPGLRNRQQRLNQICEKYQLEGSIESLEGLAEATRDMAYIDRSDIFNNLLAAHIRNDDPSKALGVWTQLQDEDIQPSDSFLLKLAGFLEKKGLPVPFVKPQTQPPSPKQDVTDDGKKSVDSNTIALNGFRNALKTNNIEGAILKKRQLDATKVRIPAHDLSHLLEVFCQNSKINDAFNLAISMLENGDKIAPKHFKFFSNKLAGAGEVEKLTRLGSMLDNETKKLLSFDNKVCGAFLNAGRSNEYMNSLLHEIESSKPEDITMLEEKFPRGAIVGVIETHPELIPKFEQIAAKYYKLGSSSPANILWISYFITPGMESRADQVWETYNLRNVNRLMFQRILTKARAEKDNSFVDRLLERVKDTGISDPALGVIYSCSLDISISSDKPEEALSSLNKYVEGISLDNFNTSTLIRLKRALEVQGKEFPFMIPTKIKRMSYAPVPNLPKIEEEEVPEKPDYLIWAIGFTSSAIRKLDEPDWKKYLKDYSGVLRRCPLTVNDVLEIRERTSQPDPTTENKPAADDSVKTKKQ